jgi:voltage-gated potassium channel
MLRRLAYAFAVLGAILVVGTVGYMAIEGWGFADAVYMTVITVGTVGFSEVHVLSAAGRVFTMGLIIVGFGGILFALGTIIDFMVEGHFSGLLEGRRMDKRIAGMSGHHVVAGLGRVGSTVAEEYAARGVQFVVLDLNDEALTRARERGWAFISGDASAEETLLAAGIMRARSLVTALDTDADNLFVTLTARGMNPALFIVARSTAETAEPKLRRAGADRVITPTEIGGRRMAAMVLQPVVSEYLDVVTRGEALQFKLEEIVLRESDPYTGRSIGDSRIRAETGAYILAVHRAGGDVNTNPAPELVLEAGDRLVAIGTEDQLALLAGKACRSPQDCRSPGL